jgi:hypothetical protein
MPVRQKIVARHPDGRKLVMIQGDELPWKFNEKEDVYYVTSKDGRARYVVARSRPIERDRSGRMVYSYWQARVRIDDGEIINLGDEHMIAFEGQEVCQIYDSARLDPKPVTHESKRLTDDT